MDSNQAKSNEIEKKTVENFMSWIFQLTTSPLMHENAKK